MNDQLNLIVSNIEQNETKLKSLKEKEISLKDELSKMIIKSYKEQVKFKQNEIYFFLLLIFIRYINVSNILNNMQIINPKYYQD